MEKTGCMVQCEKYTDADAFLKVEYSLVDKLRKYVTTRNMDREFLVVIAVVAKVLCKHGIWLVTCVHKAGHRIIPVSRFCIQGGLHPCIF